jgi:uncharacterized protein (TIGR00255 family)
MKSMTAYGRGEYALGDKTYFVELKSVNNRYRDIVLRMPRSLQELEEDVRTFISSRVRRGRLETAIQISINGKEEDYQLELNRPLVKAYQEIFRQLNSELGTEYDPNPEALSQIKDIIIMKPEEIDLEETKSGLIGALAQALDALDEMKNREGDVLAGDTTMRIDLIKKHLDDIKTRVPHIVEEYRDKLKTRLETIMPNIEIDESRLAQEIAIFAERSDITEEIVRAGSHLKQFQEIMSLDDSIGRRLDFLLQELNREFNTMSAKASNADVSARVVEIKAELEKIREQIQNVE